MAKRRRGRSMKNYMRGMCDEGCSLGALASGVAAVAPFDETVVEPTIVSSIDGAWSLDAVKNPEGPVRFGVAHADYTQTEIQEHLQVTDSWNEGNLVDQERSNRKIRTIGLFSAYGGVAGEVTDYQWNAGRPVKTKLNWRLEGTGGLQIWAYNVSPLTMTTGANIKFAGHANLWRQG